MGWEDRSYYRDQPSSGGGNPLMWLMTGSLSVGRWFGIDVRIHATMLLYVVLTILLWSGGSLSNRITSMTVLFGIVLLHEFGHCFAARWVGGNPRQIIMHPLGGLAQADAPNTARAQFITVIGGPLVNVLICLITYACLWLTVGPVNIWNPFNPVPPGAIHASELTFYLWWIFTISYILLLFNILPIFPLDGGQLLRSILWLKMGFYRASLIAATAGMVGSAIIGVLGLMSGGFILVLIAIMCFSTSSQLRQQLKAAGPWAFQDEPDYARSLRNEPRRSVLTGRASQRKEKQAADEQAAIDRILAKVSEHGMQSLTWMEKRTLRKATERQRKN